jgi:thymidylate synthase
VHGNRRREMKQYLEMCEHVLTHGNKHNNRTGTWSLSVFGYQIRFSLADGLGGSTFPLLTTKKLPFRWIVEEMLWFLSGSTNESALREKGINIWKEWADEETTASFGREKGDLGPVYGYLWRSFGGDYPERNGTDQIARLMEMLQENRESRRLIVSGWDPAQCDNVSLPPCHTLVQFKVEEPDLIEVDPELHPDFYPPGIPMIQDDRPTLHCHLYMRSADLFLGVPFNIASYALLTCMIAEVMEFKVGDFVHTFGDLHIYNNHLDQVKEQLEREPYSSPRIKIDPPPYLDPFEQLINIKYDNIKLENYKAHPSIKGDVAV